MREDPRGATAMSTFHENPGAASISQQRVLAALRRCGGRATAAHLAKLLSLHVSTVRDHLTALEESGILSSSPLPAHRPGRPSIEYALVSDTAGTAQNALLSAMADAVSDDPALVERVERRMIEWTDAVPTPAGERSPRERLCTVFSALGFSPEKTEGGLVLRTCPFLGAAVDHPEVVCRIHAAVARRVVASEGGPATTVTLVPFAPPDGLCRVRVRGD